MAFSGLGAGSGAAPHSGPMAEINMIPLVDVMLVLLIIFMITAPLIAHRIKIDLPQASTVLLEEKPDTIVIFPWNLRDEIIGQLAHARSWGAQFVTAIPELQIR